MTKTLCTIYFISKANLLYRNDIFSINFIFFRAPRIWLIAKRNEIFSHLKVATHGQHLKDIFQNFTCSYKTHSMLT